MQEDSGNAIATQQGWPVFQSQIRHRARCISFPKNFLSSLVGNVALVKHRGLCVTALNLSGIAARPLLQPWCVKFYNAI